MRHLSLFKPPEVYEYKIYLWFNILSYVCMPFFIIHIMLYNLYMYVPLCIGMKTLMYIIMFMHVKMYIKFYKLERKC